MREKNQAMEGSEIVDSTDWTLADLESELRCLSQDGRIDTPQADAVRERICKLSEAEGQTDG